MYEKPPLGAGLDPDLSPTCTKTCADYKAMGACNSNWVGCNSAFPTETITYFCQCETTSVMGKVHIFYVFCFLFLQIFDERTGQKSTAPMTFWSIYGEKVSRNKENRGVMDQIKQNNNS